MTRLTPDVGTIGERRPNRSMEQANEAMATVTPKAAVSAPDNPAITHIATTTIGGIAAVQ
jgi:hypothetical protein